MARKKLFLVDIVPGKVYLYRRQSATAPVYEDWPCTVECTEERGWLRGFVDISSKKLRFKPLGSETFISATIYDNNATDDPKFVYDVQEMPDDWHPCKAKNLQMQIDKIMKELELINTIG